MFHLCCKISIEQLSSNSIAKLMLYLQLKAVWYFYTKQNRKSNLKCLQYTRVKFCKKDFVSGKQFFFFSDTVSEKCQREKGSNNSPSDADDGS